MCQTQARTRNRIVYLRNVDRHRSGSMIPRTREPPQNPRTHREKKRPGYGLAFVLRPIGVMHDLQADQNMDSDRIVASYAHGWRRLIDSFLHSLMPSTSVWLYEKSHR
mmetsp:Transcript_7925/g.23367  ORF Transcript_7925/g.23367 Transcript_7925/m.23367 type:complete len:108 (-) Transcript_7925:871-1194(-)